ncbi:MAG: hypothetical protein CVU42_16200 [Chloroflexi bacterium HGW-Chloroflexi-4]|jgi:hypothetical protein|nr:MAG: hypothetical protein CVU46_18550 [Chloroflexi bacterium HGW-Chloroflexi-8]PKN97414.1 MAG: hypothetical protein CVU42_16200 [Chloroflexi bacterium HGW-Chloroflexi-4]
MLLTLLNFQYTKSNPGGEDFLINWSATRGFMTQGLSPYGSEASQSIQDELNLHEITRTLENPKFSMPLYGMLIFSPFALIADFEIARAVWMTFLEISLIAIIILSMHLTYWKINPILLTSLFLFGLFGFHGIMPLLDGSLSIPITLMTLGILITIHNKQDEAAGLMIAFTTMLPVPIGLFLIFVLVWVIATRRGKIIAWFLATFSLLLGFSFAVIPSWLIQFLTNMIGAYRELDSASPGGILINRWGAVGERFAIGISIVIGLILVFEWWQAVKGGQKRFIWTALLTLALGTWSGIKTSPLNYVLLYPALIMGLELLFERWKNKANGTILIILVVLFLGSWSIFLLTMSASFQTGVSSFLFIPLPITTIVLLYWSKWWVVKSNSVDLKTTLINLK